MVMKHRIILMLLLLAPLVGNAQVTFRARIFLPGGHLASGYFHPYLIVEGEDTARAERPDELIQAARDFDELADRLALRFSREGYAVKILVAKESLLFRSL